MRVCLNAKLIKASSVRRQEWRDVRMMQWLCYSLRALNMTDSRAPMKDFRCTTRVVVNEPGLQPIHPNA